MITLNVKLAKLVSRARRMKRIRDGVVLCDNCGNPASLSLSLDLSWTCCAPCVWGEADSFDPEDVLRV